MDFSIFKEPFFFSAIWKAPIIHRLCWRRSLIPKIRPYLHPFLDKCASLVHWLKSIFFEPYGVSGGDVVPPVFIRFLWLVHWFDFLLRRSIPCRRLQARGLTINLFLLLWRLLFAPLFIDLYEAFFSHEGMNSFKSYLSSSGYEKMGHLETNRQEVVRA